MSEGQFLFWELFSDCPSDWEIVPFRDAVDFQEGPGILAKDFHPAGVPLIRLKGIQGTTASLDGANFLSEETVEKRWSHFRLLKEDLLLSSSASLGRVSEVGEATEGAIAYTGIIRMRPATRTIEKGYIKYFTQSHLFSEQIRMSATGSVISHFGPTHLKQMGMLLPSLPEQKAISHILGSLDDKIELNRKTNETLEAMAKALFKSWFVDFDPVRAKAEGRPTGLPAEISDLFPDSFEESELGEIPSGWRVGSLDQISINARETAKPEEMDSSDRYIGLEHMPRGSICLGESGQAEELESNKNRFRQGDLLFGKLRPYFKKTGYCQFDGVCSTDIVVVRKKGEYGVGYICCLLASDPFIDFTVAASSGTRMPRSSWKDMREFPFAIPSETLLLQFDNQFWPTVSKISSNCLNSASLADTRDTLLPKLISGELRIPDAEKLLEEAQL